MHNRLFSIVLGISVLLLLTGAGMAMAFSTPAVQVQPRASAQALATNAASTAQAAATGAASRGQNFATSAAGTVQGFETAVVGTVQPVGTNAAATAQSFATNAAATGQAFYDNANATAQAAATGIALDVDSIRATATTIVGTVQAVYAALPAEVQVIVDYLLQNSSVVYDPVTNSLLVTSYVDEMVVNELVDVVVQAAGYNPDAVLVDVTPLGINIILIDASSQLPGAVVLTYQPVVVDGRVSMVLVSASINGIPVPVEQLPADLLQGIELALTGATLQTALGLPYPVSYVVNSVSLGDSGLVLTFTVLLAPVP